MLSSSFFFSVSTVSCIRRSRTSKALEVELSTCTKTTLQHTVHHQNLGWFPVLRHDGNETLIVMGILSPCANPLLGTWMATVSGPAPHQDEHEPNTFVSRLSIGSEWGRGTDASVFVRL